MKIRDQIYEKLYRLVDVVQAQPNFNEFPHDVNDLIADIIEIFDEEMAELLPAPEPKE